VNVNVLTSLPSMSIIFIVVFFCSILKDNVVCELNGLGNIVKEATRTNLESVFDYTTQFSDIKTHNVMGTFGVVYPLFIPKKLVK
jgi:hypothetical protein